MLLTFVVPTFNRPAKTLRCVRSLLAQCSAATCEVVVVDDGSTDETVFQIERAFDAAQVRIVRHDTNRGVTAAKNTGVAHARGRFVAFMDSDDELLPDALAVVESLLQRAPEPALVFCGTVSRFGAPMGGRRVRGLHGDVDWATLLLHWNGFGEFLPLCLRSLVRAVPFDEDLRGHEGITWLRIARRIGGARIDHTPVRRYDESGTDRLSRRANLIHRAEMLAVGTSRLLAEFHEDIDRYAPGLMDRLVVRGTLYAVLAGNARIPSLKARRRGARLLTTLLARCPSVVVRGAYRCLPA